LENEALARLRSIAVREDLEKLIFIVKLLLV
jgi:hypothetical protein